MIFIAENWEIDGIISYKMVEDKYWVINWIRFAMITCLALVSLHVTDITYLDSQRFQSISMYFYLRYRFPENPERSSFPSCC